MKKHIPQKIVSNGPLVANKRVRELALVLAIGVGALRPAAGDIIPLTPEANQDCGMSISGLHVDIPTGVLVASSTTLSIISSKTNKSVMDLNTAPADVSATTSWLNQQNEDDIGATPGLKCLYRIFGEEVYVGLIFHAARPTDIPAGTTIAIRFTYNNEIRLNKTQAVSV